MEIAYVLSFLGGLSVGLVVLLMLTIHHSARAAHDPVLDPNPRCDNGVVTVTGSAGTAPTGGTLLGFIAEERASCPPAGTCPAKPAGQNPAPLPLSVGVAGTSGHIVVWSVYEIVGCNCVDYKCHEQPPA